MSRGKIMWGTVSLLLVGPAIAGSLGGGSRIANAPNIPLGEPQTGVSAPEFWRVDLRVRDLLIANLEALDPTKGSIQVCVLDPAVDDFTIDRAECKEEVVARQRTQLRFIAPKAGRWTLDVSQCAGGPATSTNCPGSTAIYELTVYVKQFTRTRLVGPKFAKPRQTVTLRGSVQGVIGGQVLIQTARPRGGWKPTAVRTVRAGIFTWTTRTSGPGTYRVRAAYAGDAGHQASSAIFTIRVIG